MILRQSSASYPILFRLALSSDHVTPATGKTPTVTLSKNGGAFSSPAGAVSEIANGWYMVAGNATDTNTLGPLILCATASSCDQSNVLNEVGLAPQLAPDALDAITTTAPTTVSGANFRQMIQFLFRRFFAKATLTTTQIKTYADDGTTVVTTQAVSNDGTTETQGAAS